MQLDFQENLIFWKGSFTTRGIKKNFSSWYRPNLACVLGCSDEDDQPHLLHCKPLLAKLDPEQRDLIGGIEYKDIYGSLEQQKAAVLAFSWLLDTRERLLEAATPVSGATLDAAPTPRGNGVYPYVHH